MQRGAVFHLATTVLAIVSSLTFQCEINSCGLSLRLVSSCH